MIPTTGQVAPHIHLLGEEVTAAAQSAPGPQMPPNIQAALGAAGQGLASSLQGRVGPQAAAQAQPLVSHKVLTAISHFGGKAYLETNLRFQDNDAIVLAAVTEEGEALHFASERLQKDYAIVHAAVTENGMALLDANLTLRNDYAIVHAAVTQKGTALILASETLRNDYAIVLAAVTQTGVALRAASETLRNNDAMVLAAVTQTGIALQFASERLQNDPAFLVKVASRNGLVLQHIPEALRTVEIASAAVAQNPAARQWVPKTILERANTEIATNPAFLPFVDPSLITYEIGQEAVKINPLLIQFIPRAILADRPVDFEANNDIISVALKGNPEAINLIPWDLMTGTMLSYVIEMHERSNRNELVRALVKFARKMGTKSFEEIKPSHLDLAWPLLPYFKNFKEVMLILINKYGLEAMNAGLGLIMNPEILAADARTKAIADALAPQARLVMDITDDGLVAVYHELV